MKIRRPLAYIGAIAVLGLVLVLRFYPGVARRLEPPPQNSAPGPADVAIGGPYFSDADHIAERIVAAINRTRQTLDVAIYDLTEPNIAGALEAARRRGVRIRIVADQQQAHEPHSEIPYLSSRGIPVRLSRGYRGNRSIMHDKFAVFDGKLAVTGSFNWTTSADNYNFENAIFISDAAAVARFESEFERLWSQAQ